MGKTVEFFFDIVSPASYLAWVQIPKLVEETSAEVIYRPVFLPGVFDKAGSSSPITVAAKGNWMFGDLQRHARKYGVEFNMNSRFPLSSVYAMRGLNNYREKSEILKLANGFFDAMWVHDQDINDVAVVTQVVSRAGIDPAEYQEKLSNPANKQALVDITEEAVSRGMFGVPTFFVDQNMHWGQDRIDFVKEDLLA
ncbi:MAG: 2-hydroxychromene-2-carboxylate isomerase [Rhizobiaceae bacterium]